MTVSVSRLYYHCFLNLWWWFFLSFVCFADLSLSPVFFLSSRVLYSLLCVLPLALKLSLFLIFGIYKLTCAKHSTACEVSGMVCESVSMCEDQRLFAILRSNIKYLDCLFSLEANNNYVAKALQWHLRCGQAAVLVFGSLFRNGLIFRWQLNKSLLVK